MSKIPPRPTWNSKAVQEQAVGCIFDDVLDWYIENGVIELGMKSKYPAGPHGIGTSTLRDLKALVTLALTQCPDAYSACRYFEDFADWPCNGLLVSIVDRAYRQMPFLAVAHVHDWVMRYGVRFPAMRGDSITFLIGSHEASGEVSDVIPKEARGFIYLRDHPRALPVLAEHVVSVNPPKKGRGAKSGVPMREVMQ